jgi:hypothetical protein
MANLKVHTGYKGVKGEFGYMYSLDQSSVELKGSVFFHYPTIPNLRGISVFSADTGAEVSADYTFKIAEIRKGFWYSTLYLADMYGGIFVDYTTLEDGQFSYGAEVAAEVGMGYWSTMVPKVGFAVSDGRITSHLIFGVGF